MSPAFPKKRYNLLWLPVTREDTLLVAINPNKCWCGSKIGNVPEVFANKVRAFIEDRKVGFVVVNLVLLRIRIMVTGVQSRLGIRTKLGKHDGLVREALVPGG